MDRGDHNEEVGVGFVGFGLTSKKMWSFEAEGLTYKKDITSRSPAEIKTEKEKPI